MLLGCLTACSVMNGGMCSDGMCNIYCSLAGTRKNFEILYDLREGNTNSYFIDTILNMTKLIYTLMRHITACCR